MNTLDRLYRWYEFNCNEDWEHTYGIKIENCDNPGWLVTIDLEDTSLQKEEFESKQYQNEDKDDWLHVKKEGFKYKAAGGPKKLEELLTVFLDWVEEHEPK